MEIITICLIIIAIASLLILPISLGVYLADPKDKFAVKTLIVSIILNFLSVIGIIYLGTHEI